MNAKKVREPGNPSAKERAEHELNHWPYRSWCEACVKGRAVGQQHRSMKGEYAESLVARVLMDYGFLHEEEVTVESEHGQEVESKTSMTIMVMLETLCSSVWGYAIEGKGAVSVEWLAQQVVEDIETVGLAAERIITKTDQEPAIIQLQQEVAKRRHEGGTALEHSRVGDSDSNGRIERAIRDMKGMIRTIRSSVEDKTGKPIKLSDTIVPWIVRHAGYILTRCKVGSDGKTAMQRMKGRKTNAPWVPFGEAVLFKLPKVPKMPGDFRDRFEEGIWVGFITRSGEHLVATDRGVFKVSSVMRRSEDKRWSGDAIQKIQGSPKEPIPGSGSSNIVAYSKTREDKDRQPTQYAPREIEEPEVRANYIYKRDVEQFGATEGCAGCRALMNPFSKFRAKHTPECRARMEVEMMKSNEGAMRVIRAMERHNLAKANEDEKGEKDTDGKKRKQDEQGGNKAAGSGMSEEERKKGLEKKKESEAKAMEEDEEPKVEDDKLEEAPKPQADIRVPLAERKPAEKRSRDSTDSPRGGAKWQAFEKEVEDRKRKADNDEDDAGGKFQAIEESKDVNVDSIGKSGHPGPRVKNEDIAKEEMVWRDVGSGVMARTFKGAKRLQVSTKGGPAEADVERRTIWNLDTGKIIDDCMVEDTPDSELYRELPFETNIRVELTLKSAIDMYKRIGADVVEVYSQPRIAQEAAMRMYDGMKLVPGWSLDLTRSDPKTGKPWDLGDRTVQSRVKKMILESKPLFVIGSPPCTAFSVMQNINKDKRDPEVIKKEIEEGRKHLKFCMELYKMQVDGKRFFVHEHPAGATSWETSEMVKMAMMKGVDIITFDMCAFGMVATKDGVEGPVRKRSKLASNSKEVLKRIERRCPNDVEGEANHVHVVLEGSRTKRAQVYPRAFCQSICEGIAAEKRLKSLGLEVYSLEEAKELTGYGDSPSEDLHEGDEEWMSAMDDQTGEALDTAKVREARREEIVYFKDMKVYKKVPISQCRQETGREPIGVRWVDINKGDSTNPNYRSRLVAQ